MNGTREDAEFSLGAHAGAQPFLFLVAVLKKGGSLAGGLALPVRKNKIYCAADFSTLFSLLHSQPPG